MSRNGFTQNLPLFQYSKREISLFWTSPTWHVWSCAFYHKYVVFIVKTQLKNLCSNTILHVQIFKSVFSKLQPDNVNKYGHPGFRLTNLWFLLQIISLIDCILWTMTGKLRVINWRQIFMPFNLLITHTQNFLVDLTSRLLGIWNIITAVLRFTCAIDIQNKR